MNGYEDIIQKINTALSNQTMGKRQNGNLGYVKEDVQAAFVLFEDFKNDPENHLITLYRAATQCNDNGRRGFSEVCDAIEKKLTNTPRYSQKK